VQELKNGLDTGAVAICALRYCFGRRTYMPSLVIDWLKRHWTKLSLPNQETIHRDIKEAIQSERDLGDMCCGSQT
jgi:alpha-glucuronidase